MNINAKLLNKILLTSIIQQHIERIIYKWDLFLKCKGGSMYKNKTIYYQQNEEKEKHIRSLQSIQKKHLTKFNILSK